MTLLPSRGLCKQGLKPGILHLYVEEEGGVEQGDSERAAGIAAITHKETGAEQEINGCQVLPLDPNPPGSLLMILAEVKLLTSDEKTG